MADIAETVRTSEQFPADFGAYVDVESGLKRVAGNQGIYVRILKSFLNSEEFEKLQTAADSGDVQAAALVAHGIKGMSGNLSLTQLYNDTVAFEGPLKQGVCDPAAKDAFFETLEKTKTYIGVLLEAVG